jgi:glutamyl-tRNA synthetase
VDQFGAQAQLLYDYFGWDMPQLCHLPLLRNPDKSKLSKRKNPTSILYYQRMGFLPEALLNYLGRMGWSMPDEREKFTLEEMLGAFDISRVSLGGPIFDMEKLRWLNGLWIREELSGGGARRAPGGLGLQPPTPGAVLPHLKPRIETLSDFAPQAAFLVAGDPGPQRSAIRCPGRRSRRGARRLQFALWRLEGLRHWDRDAVWEALKGLADALDQGARFPGAAVHRRGRQQRFVLGGGCNGGCWAPT